MSNGGQASGEAFVFEISLYFFSLVARVWRRLFVASARLNVDDEGVAVPHLHDVPLVTVAVPVGELVDDGFVMVAILRMF